MKTRDVVVVGLDGGFRDPQIDASRLPWGPAPKTQTLRIASAEEVVDQITALQSIAYIYIDDYSQLKSRIHICTVLVPDFHYNDITPSLH